MMNGQTNSEKERLEKVELKVKQIKGFYMHLTLYLVINTSLILVKLIGNFYYGESFMGPFWHFSTFASWLFWGIGLFFHGVKVFYGNPIFSKEWEKRQIQKYMEQDKREAEKYGRNGR